MKHALAAALAVLAVPLGAQLPERVGPQRLLDTGAGVFPPFVSAAADRGESTLANYFHSSSKTYRLGPQGLPSAPFTLADFEQFAPGAADTVWSCHRAFVDPDGYDLVCQLRGRDFAPLAAPLTVKSTQDMLLFALSSDAAGNLVVAWREYPIMTQDPGTIGFRRLAASGTFMAPPVAAFGGDTALYALGLATFPSGGFALITERDTPPRTVWAQVVSSAGVPGTPFQVAVPPADGSDSRPAVSSAGNGFAVTWLRGTTPGMYETLLQRFGPNGQAVSPPATFLGVQSTYEALVRLGCDGWGRCVLFGSSSHRFYDGQGAPASAALAGGGGSTGNFDIAVNGSGAFTLVQMGSQTTPPALSRLPPPPIQFGIWSQRYQGPLKGDLDADRSTDIVLQSTSTRALELWGMNGTTRVGASRPIAVVPAVGWQAVGADDFDGDWRQDLALWNTSSGAVEFWSMGGADGTTRLSVHPLTGIAPLAPPWRPAATGDFDGDGKPDLLWRNESTGLLRLWTLDGSAYRGTLTPDPAQAPDLGWRVAAAVDLDNDGRRDLVWTHTASSGVAFWYLDTALHMLDSRLANPSTSGGSGWQLVGAGEFGAGTGRAATPAPDLLWRHQTSGQLVVWHMSPQGTRIAGTFTDPEAPDNALDWNVVGPR